MNGAGAFRSSEFTAHFNCKDIQLCILKLDIVNITDPYNAPGVLFTSIETTEKDDVPGLQYPDIYNYFINFPSAYSGESLKAYKSLEGYKWTKSGFVMNIKLWGLPAKTSFVIIGRVRVTYYVCMWYRIAQKPNVRMCNRAVVRNDGVVLGAHCSCTAGLGESCSHVSAVLFMVWQHNHGRKEEMAITSKKCKWATPSDESLKRVEYQQGKDIIFNKLLGFGKKKFSVLKYMINNIL